MIDEYLNSLESLLTEPSNDVAEIEDVMKQLEIQIHNITDSKRKQEVAQKIAVCKKAVDEWRCKALLENKNGFNHNMSKIHREDARLTTLQNARNTLIETEDVSRSILNNLNQQEDTIRRAVDKTKTINSALSSSNRLLTKMGKWWRG